MAHQDPIIDKIIVARVSLLLKHPFFGNMATRLKIQEAEDWLPTAATDGRTIYFNRKFFDPLTVKQVEFVIAHEILHNVFDHMGRREGRNARDANTVQVTSTRSSHTRLLWVRRNISVHRIRLFSPR